MEFIRSIGCKHNQGNPGMVRLKHGGVQIRHRAARRRDHRGSTTGFEADAQRDKGSYTFIHTNVHGDQTALFKFEGRKSQCLRARPGGDNDISQSACSEAGKKPERKR